MGNCESVEPHVAALKESNGRVTHEQLNKLGKIFRKYSAFYSISFVDVKRQVGEPHLHSLLKNQKFARRFEFGVQHEQFWNAASCPALQLD